MLAGIIGGMDTGALPFSGIPGLELLFGAGSEPLDAVSFDISNVQMVGSKLNDEVSVRNERTCEKSVPVIGSVLGPQ